ncbi:MAG: ABC transporter substrate-binding protein [Elusimicrobia bacterium]|nr:ABC transporter substrate-binding protein [Elusimicrobiota bacterium]
MKRVLSVAHSPDPDDAFMFYGIVKGGVLPDGWRVKHVLKDIQSLNRDARKGLYEVTAVSTAAFPSIARKYWILSVGASVGRGYGPVLVCRPENRKAFASKNWAGLRIATPGPETTALLLLRLAHPEFVSVDTRFDKIPDVVRRGRADAGLVIHESQMTFAKQGLVKVMDLGRWWHNRTGLPIPLGLDVVRKDMGRVEARRMAGLLKKAFNSPIATKTRRCAMPLVLAVAWTQPWANGLSKCR